MSYTRTGVSLNMTCGFMSCTYIGVSTRSKWLLHVFTQTVVSRLGKWWVRVSYPWVRALLSVFVSVLVGFTSCSSTAVSAATARRIPVVRAQTRCDLCAYWTAHTQKVFATNRTESLLKAINYRKRSCIRTRRNTRKTVHNLRKLTHKRRHFYRVRKMFTQLHTTM